MLKTKVVSTCYYCIILSIIFFSFNVKSETLTVSYKTFYSHLSKLKSDETKALQFAFGFLNIQNKRLCDINSALISTDKKQIPLVITAENRFTLPTEKALKLANALVIIELADAANVCDISVQLETKQDYLKDKYSSDELTVIYQNYESFFDSVGGFMSFMMPEVEGIIFHFDDENLSEPLFNQMTISNGKLLVNFDEIKLFNQIQLPQTPKRITAKLSK